MLVPKDNLDKRFQSRKRCIIQSSIDGNFAKSSSGHLQLENNMCAKYHDPSSRGSPAILLTMFHRITMHKSKKGHNSVKYSHNFMKSQSGHSHLIHNLWAKYHDHSLSGSIDILLIRFHREGSPYIACNERQAFFTSEDTKRYKLWSCRNVCEALIYLLNNIYIRFGTKLYRKIVGIPMGTNCAPLVADLFLFCYERDFMTSLSEVKQAEILEAFKSTSRYLDDLLNIDNPYFEGMVNRIYPPELQLNKANTSDTEAPFLDLHLSISNGFISSNIYDKRDDFDFDIVNFPFLDGDVPRSTSYGVYISQLIRFARVSSHVVDFNARNKSLTAKLLQQGYRYHKLRKTFSKFYRRHYELVSKFNVGLKTLLHQGLSEPEFYGDLVYKFKKIVGRADFSDQFRKIIVRYKRIGYNIDIMRQSAC